MDAVVDTSTLQSLARSGLLTLLADAPFSPVILDVVHDEAVRSGIAGGYPDAPAIEAALRDQAVQSTAQAGGSADDRVLTAAADVGCLISNDLALGRRARNLGATWLRTADVIVWMTRAGRIAPSAGSAAIGALRDTGRISEALAESYLEDLR